MDGGVADGPHGKKVFPHGSYDVGGPQDAGMTVCCNFDLL
jgi:hypothetical protein